MIDLRIGDCREILATLPPKSVQCCVTSPPYFGLRDYGVDGQMGLEPTLAEYITGMVDVFRLVRDVLADDGTFWLNCGDSFASASTGSNRSRQPRSEPAYGNGGTEQSGSILTDSACHHLCDECQAALSSRSSDNCQPDHVYASLHGQTVRDNGHLDSVAAIPDDAAHDVRVSTNHESSRLPRGECCHCDNCGACLSVLRSTSRDARLCVRNSARIGDTDSHLLTSDGRTGDTEPWAMALAEPPYVQPQYTINLKPKDLMMVPARLAIALQDDGWYLRSDIVWAKPNPMPESVTDRPTSAHEHIFLLTKSARYYYDADAIREPLAASSVSRLSQDVAAQEGSHRANGGTKTNGTMKAVQRTDKQRGHIRRHDGFNDRWDAMSKAEQQANGANARNVWSIATHPFPGAHFATFPPEIPRRCILAGSREGDTILDPFAGAGTTLLVADRLGRNGIGIELNPEYAQMARDRIYNDAPMFAGVTA